MGFLEHIPATGLKARYNTVSKQLILTASGDAVRFTSGITFERQPWAGGLKFALSGWVGPITGGEQPYDYTQSFSIDLPTRALPSNTVIFVTANCPDGKVVDIEFFDGEPLPPSGIPDGPGTGGGDPEKIIKIFKVPFQITASSETPSLGTVGVKFDPRHLELTDAGIIAPKNIAWTFNSLQTGNTQIIVTTREGGGSEVIIVKKYNLSIVLPTFIGEPGPVVIGQDTPDPVPTGSGDPLPVDDLLRPPHIPLSWLGFVNIGINLIKKAYPLGVQLLEVDATPSVPGEVTNPSELNQLRIVTRVTVNRAIPHATAIIKSTGWGHFGPITVTKEPWLGDVVIDWPIEMDIVESFELLQAAGYTSPVDNCTLRHPLYPGLNEPYYIYGFPTGQFVGVGVKDKKVEPFGSGNLGYAKLT